MKADFSQHVQLLEISETEITYKEMSYLSLKIFKLFKQRLHGHLPEKLKKEFPVGKKTKQDKLRSLQF